MYLFCTLNVACYNKGYEIDSERFVVGVQGR